MKISLLTLDHTYRHPINPRELLSDDIELSAYPAPEGYCAVPWDPTHDALPPADMTPAESGQSQMLSAGCPHAGRIYDISDEALTAWDRAAGLLAIAYRRGVITDSTSAQSVIGPIRDINGEAVPPMTVAQLDLLLLAIGRRVAEIRASA